MAYGSILGQNPTAQNTLYNNAQTSSIITANNVQGAIDQLFTSVSNGKQEIASAITDKGVSTSADDTFATMAENIGKISTGIGLNELASFAKNNTRLIQMTPGMVVACINAPQGGSYYWTGNFYFVFYNTKQIINFQAHADWNSPSNNYMRSSIFSSTSFQIAYAAQSGFVTVDFDAGTITLTGASTTVTACVSIYTP